MIAGLILAAGESSRMGRDKALLTFHGRTFLETIISTLQEAAVHNVAVVLGHRAEEIQKAAKLEGVQVVINSEWRQGQTSSLQAGLRALDRPYLEAIVLALVDHPAVSVATLQALITCFRDTAAPLVIPVRELKRGHPVIISRALFPELLSLQSDEGANLVTRKYRDSTQFLEVDDPGILLDVDDEETFRRL